MKNFFRFFLILSLLSTSAACDGSKEVQTQKGTRYVECEGFFTDLNPSYKYKPNAENFIFAVVGGVGTLFTPLGFFGPVVVGTFWALEFAYCPTSEVVKDT